MPAFEYIAANDNGTEIKGSIEGDTEKHVSYILKEKGLFPISIKKLTNKQPLNKKINLVQTNLSSKDLALFTRQLATLIGSGVPLDEALISINEQQKKQYAKNIILGVHSKIMEGYTLAESFSEFPDSFPLIYITTISAGEQSGHLTLILKKLANFTESKRKLQQQVKHALIYPSALIITALLVISFMLAYVVPKVIYIFENFDQQLPLLTRIVISLSDLIRENWLIIIIFIVLLIALIKYFLKDYKIKKKCHTLLLQFPIFGRLTMNMNSARFMQTLSILSGSGAPILDALKMSANVITNIPMKEAAEVAAIKVSEGESISRSLSSSHLFPSMMIHMIGSGENSGRLEEMLDRATENQEEEVKNTIDVLLGIMQPLTVIFMAVIVLLIVLAILLPIFEINNLIA